MERKILIANTKTQKRYTLDNVDVNTLGELKKVLDDNHYDYSGMSFTEGISNTQLLDDNSQLPHDVDYKGRTTNDLVILLTNTQKNIPLGAVSAERARLFDFIKSHNLQSMVMAEFHKNMTQVSTDALKNFVSIYRHGNEEAAGEAPADNAGEKSELDHMADDILARHGFASDDASDEDDDDNDEAYAGCIAKSLVTLVNDLYEADALTDDDLAYIRREI